MELSNSYDNDNNNIDDDDDFKESVLKVNGNNGSINFQSFRVINNKNKNNNYKSNNHNSEDDDLEK